MQWEGPGREWWEFGFCPAWLDGCSQGWEPLDISRGVWIWHPTPRNGMRWFKVTSNPNHPGIVFSLPIWAGISPWRHFHQLLNGFKAFSVCLLTDRSMGGWQDKSNIDHFRRHPFLPSSSIFHSFYSKLHPTAQTSVTKIFRIFF